MVAEEGADVLESTALLRVESHHATRFVLACHAIDTLLRRPIGLARKELRLPDVPTFGIVLYLLLEAPETKGS